MRKNTPSAPTLDGDPCMFPDCAKPIRSAGVEFCRSHNQGIVAFGTFSAEAQMLIRFGRHIAPGPDGCWVWNGSVKPNGYGQFHFVGRANSYAHRASWELHCGDIPEGYTIDHLCRNTRCVNPAHLEPVPNKVNQERRAALIAACVKGHPFDEANTKIDAAGRRRCRACDRERSRRARTDGPRMVAAGWARVNEEEWLEEPNRMVEAGGGRS